MKQKAEKATHSGFAKFSDLAARDRFVETMIAEEAPLKDKAYLPASRPTIVFENLTERQRERIVAALEKVGRWFDDVQFQSTK